MNEIDKIRKVLKSLGISHGHLHMNNLTIVPQKDTEGNPDPSQQPKIFVIDFDESTYQPAGNEFLDEMEITRARFEAAIAQPNFQPARGQTLS